MSQRESGYERKERDFYETPEWVTELLLPHIPKSMDVWEPAAGSGKMARALERGGHTVEQSDITTNIFHPNGDDFLSIINRPWPAIITNPPYALAQQFIEHALKMTKSAGLVAMLLRTDYDHAKTRQHLFGGCRQFAKKLVLTRRIVWFDGPNAAPSFNHAWYIWDWKNEGPPILAYAPFVRGT
jgi:hypothetical protein